MAQDAGAIAEEGTSDDYAYPPSEEKSSFSLVAASSNFDCRSSGTGTPVFHENSSFSVVVSSTFEPRLSDAAVLGRSATNLVMEYFSETDVLRASYISTVLHAWCEVMGASLGPEQTYAMSHGVKGIGTFISHNWSVGRLDKFFVLCLYFNLGLLACYAALAVVAAVFLDSLGLSPTLSLTLPDPLDPLATARETQLTCQLLSLGSFFVLLFGHEAAGLCGLGSPFLPLSLSVFLDKTCIDQRTEEAKMAGIHNLGTFIVHSKRFFVIYTDAYFSRLWTVYEIATFLLLKPDCEIVVFPTTQARIILGLFAMSMVGRVVYLLSHSKAVVDLLEERGLAALSHGCWLIFSVACHSAFFFYDREWAHQQSRMAENIRQFSLDNADCSQEGDRGTLKADILSFVRHAEDIALPGSSDEETLAAFEAHVREVLPGRLRMHGAMTQVAPYRCLAAVTHSVALLGVDELLGPEPDGAFQCFACCASAFCFWPLYIQLTHWLAGRCLPLRRAGWKEWLYILPVSCTMVVFRNATAGGLRGLARFCHQCYARGGYDRAWGLLVLAGAVLMQACLALWCFGPPARWPRKRA